MTDFDEESRKFHTFWQRTTGRATVGFDVYARAAWERWIFEAKKRGWGGKDLKAVIYHVKDRAGSWKTPQLRLNNLLDVEAFQDNLAEAKVARDERRNQRPAPSPRERVLAQAGRPEAQSYTAGVHISKVIEEMRKAIQ